MRVEPLDAYLQKQAGPDAKKRAAAPFILTPDGKTIAGYYTLSQYAIELGDLPDELAKKLPQYPLVSATLLGRLTVGVDSRGQGFAEILLIINGRSIPQSQTERANRIDRCCRRCERRRGARILQEVRG